MKTSIVQVPAGKSGEYIIPTGVSTIVNSAFLYCYKLTSVVIPEGVNKIEDHAFDGCQRITEITIPNSVTKIGEDVFSWCSDLTQIVVYDNNEYYISLDGVLFDKSMTSVIRYPCGKTGTYSIPEGIQSIHNTAFEACMNLTSIIIPDGVKTIGNFAFNQCYNLTSITMGTGVETIGWYAFWYCPISSVILPDTVSVIGDYAFANCSELKSALILNINTTIGENTFDDCGNLTIFAISGSTAEIYANVNSIPFLNEGLIIQRLPDKTTYYLDENIDLSGLKIFYLDGISIEQITNYEVAGYDPNTIGTQEITISYDNSFVVFYIIVKSLEDEYTYTVSDSQATITGYTGAGGDITIPNVLGGVPVIALDSWAFSSCYSLTKVIIPDSVTSIGERAFHDCNNLTSLTIPNSVTSIGDMALFACSSLTEIIVDTENVSFSSEDGVLYNKEKSILLQYPGGKTGASYSIPKSVTAIDYYAFAFSWGLNSILVNENNLVYSSEDGVLFNKDKSVLIQYPGGKSGHYDIPGSVKSIGHSAFFWCLGLTSVKIPDSVTIIEVDAFSACMELTSVVIPNSVLIIKNSAFSDCHKLTSVVISDSVTNIGTSAFAWCYNLMSVTIGKSITYIGSRAFEMCSSVTIHGYPGSYTQIYADDNGISFVPLEGFYIMKQPIKTTYYLGDTLDLTGLQVVVVDENHNIEEIMNYEVTGYDANTLGNQIITISYNGNTATFNIFVATIEEKDYTYSITDSQATITGYTGIGGDINIPSTLGGYPVTRIGNSAFYRCVSLKTVNIPDSIISIGVTAFYCCSSLTNVTLSESLTNIGTWAFLYCSSLTCVNIPDSVTNIGGRAFLGCSSLENIIVDVENTAYASEDGVLFNKDKSNLIQYPAGKTGSYSIPDKVTSVGILAFSECNGLTDITIPDSINSIGNSAFGFCYSLVNIIVDANNMAYASEDGVLFNKDKSNLIQCPAGKKGSYSIPDGIITVGDSAFGGCSSLTSVTIPDSVTSIGFGAFEQCNGLTVVSVPNSVTSIGDYMFFYCSGLLNIIIPNSILTIGDSAFYGCSSLKRINIPSSVTNIGSYAFYGCSGMKSVAILNDSISMPWSAFYNCPELTLYCCENSTTQTYAINNSIPYELIQFSPSTSGPGCNIDYANNIITGLSGGIESLEGYFDVEAGYELTYIPTPNGFGTGTIVNVVSTAKNAMPNSIVASYTVIIYGDVNGDASIDSMDAGIMVDYENYVVSWDPTTDAAKIKAADLNSDGSIDSLDAGITVDAENYVITIDQTTGQVA